MPKKTSNSSRTVADKNDGAEVAYYVYANGNSIWGAGIYKHGERPIKGNKEVHQKTQAERIEWHKEKTAELAEAK